MTHRQTTKRALAVIVAAGVVVALGVLLTARVAARSKTLRSFASSVERPTPPAATFPQPRPIVLEELPIPFCWGCSRNSDAPLEFQVDLDLLAPLGDGAANAATWFREFAPDGKRFATEGRRAYGERMVRLLIDGDSWRVLPSDDPLLLEAEPWVDQAHCSFYPDVWPIDGVETSLPPLLMMLDLARSWVAQGKLGNDSQAALGEFRRAIRLGRLLRQDDATVIQDLVAISVIRLGAEALYEQAREDGDAATMVVASLVLADKDAMRQMSAMRITEFERAFAVDDPNSAELSLQVTDDELITIARLTRELSERRFRMEGLIALHAVSRLGSPWQRTLADGVLNEIADGPDELLAQAARQFSDAPADSSALREMIRDMH